MTASQVEQSPMVRELERLVVAVGPERAHDVLDEVLSALSPVELAALGSAWEGVWARPAQIAPAGEWLVWLLLTGRGWGKTMTVARNIIGMVQRGEVREIGMAAQNDEKTYDVNVCSLIAAAPPRFVPEWIDSEAKLVFPNGAQAYAFTPEAPGNIRSKNLDLAWMSELQSWPETTRQEAYLNFKFATRVGKARTIVDCTPKRGHPIITSLLKSAKRNPELYRETRGSMRDNYAHLAPAAVAVLIEEFAGTSAGQEELEGVMLDEAEGALFKLESFHRREPTRLVRSVISIDPAVTKRSGSDRTGIIHAGLDVDGVAVVCGDRTGKLSPGEWSEIVVTDYMRHRCDLVVVETNKGGDLLTQTLRATAATMSVDVVVVQKDWVPRHTPGVVHVREIFSRGEKADRAKPTATAYEKRRVAHLLGADLQDLENLLTTWEPKPGARSPDRLDALVGAVEELLGLGAKRVNPKKGFEGLVEANATIAQPPVREGLVVTPKRAAPTLAAFYRKGSGPRI